MLFLRLPKRLLVSAEWDEVSLPLTAGVEPGVGPRCPTAPSSSGSRCRIPSMPSNSSSTLVRGPALVVEPALPNSLTASMSLLYTDEAIEEARFLPAAAAFARPVLDRVFCRFIDLPWYGDCAVFGRLFTEPRDPAGAVEGRSRPEPYDDERDDPDREVGGKPPGIRSAGNGGTGGISSSGSNGWPNLLFSSPVR